MTPISDESRPTTLHGDPTLPVDRKTMEAFLTQAILQSERRRKRVAVLCIGLGSSGRAGPEHLLEAAWVRIQSAIREADLACRLALDEFVVVAPEIDGRSGAETMSRRILQALSGPFALADGETSLGVSIGVAIYPLHGSMALELVQVAQKAMSQARESAESDFTILE